MTHYDVLVVGSGFGGSVAALRLTEKGYRVGVLEAGARFEDDEFASGTLDITRFLWAPALGCYGIQRIDAVRDTLIVAGYRMIFAGSSSVCRGYQNCKPRNCVAPSTVINGSDSSSIRNTLPTGCAFSGCRVPLPTGPCIPTSEAFIRRTSPPATG